MKIYTKTGDTGNTGLFGGQRVSKDSALIDACGAVDELNASLGVAVSGGVDEDIVAVLTRVQGELFVVGADIATPITHSDSVSTAKATVPRVTLAMIEALELEIDQYTDEAGPLTNFILPGGSPVGASIHLARTICRRAERVAIRATKSEKISPDIIVYLNRLSDHLFEMARVINKRANRPETIWSRDSV